jgi:hypothetical protein
MGLGARLSDKGGEQALTRCLPDKSCLNAGSLQLRVGLALRMVLACIIHKSGAPKIFFVRVNNHETTSEFG